MDVLVLGGTGEISRYMVNRLLDNAEKVTVFNRGNRKEWIDNRAENVVVDVNVPSQLKAALKDRWFDAVIDFTTYLKCEMKIKYGTIKFHCGRYIFVSSCAVYYKNRNKSYKYIEEDSEYNTDWVYGYNKRECEEYLAGNAVRDKLDYTIIRPGCTYGDSFIPCCPVDSYWKRSFVIDRLNSDEKILLLNGGEDAIQVMHAEDFAENIYSLMNLSSTRNVVYNVSGDESYSVKDIVRMIADCVGEKPQIINGDISAIKEYPELRFIDFSGRFSNQKLKNRIELSSRHRLVDCIPHMIDNIIKCGYSTEDWYMAMYNDMLKKYIR